MDPSAELLLCLEEACKTYHKHTKGDFELASLNDQFMMEK